MFEKFTSQGAGDFRQRYQGTFGFFRNNHEKKPPLLCKLNFVEERIGFVDKRGVEYTLNPDVQEDIGFQFLPPKAGYFNTDVGALLVMRIAARQFQRGISDRNTHIYTVGGPAGFRQVKVDFANLERVFDTKITYKDALAKFNEGTLNSFAISPQFGTDGARIHVLANPCGQLVWRSPDLWKIKLDDPDLFRTEINDALKTHMKVEFVQ